MNLACLSILWQGLFIGLLSGLYRTGSLGFFFVLFKKVQGKNCNLIYLFTVTLMVQVLITVGMKALSVVPTISKRYTTLPIASLAIGASLENKTKIIQNAPHCVYYHASQFLNVLLVPVLWLVVKYTCIGESLRQSLRFNVQAGAALESKKSICIRSLERPKRNEAQVF